MLDVGLASAGLVAVMVAWATYMATVPSGKVPVRPVGHVLLQLLGIGLAVGGLVTSLQADGLSVGVVVPAAIALMMGPLFLVLLALSKTPDNEIQIEVGKPLLPFSAKTSDGSAFDTSAFEGKRILLKFFRGGW